MPFLTPLQVQFLDDRSVFPWITISPLEYESELTGEVYTVPKHFRTDGASVPRALMLFAPPLAARFFGQGVWHGFKQGVLHDYLRRGPNPPVSAKVAHLVFREALQSAGYPDDICNNYFAAVVKFNS